MLSPLAPFMPPSSHRAPRTPRLAITCAVRVARQHAMLFGTSHACYKPAYAVRSPLSAPAITIQSSASEALGIASAAASHVPSSGFPMTLRRLVSPCHAHRGVLKRPAVRPSGLILSRRLTTDARSAEPYLAAMSPSAPKPWVMQAPWKSSDKPVLG